MRSIDIDGPTYVHGPGFVRWMPVSVLIGWIGALHVRPPSVERMKRTPPTMMLGSYVPAATYTVPWLSNTTNGSAQARCTASVTGIGARFHVAPPSVVTAYPQCVSSVRSATDGTMPWVSSCCNETCV